MLALPPSLLVMKICDQPVNYLLNVFKTTFISVAENHAPIIQKRVRGIDSCPLLDSSIKMSKETLGENLNFAKNIKAQSNILSGLIY